MLFSGFNDLKFIDLEISGQIIMWFFVAIVTIALVIFIFNLVFIRPASSHEKVKNSEADKKRQEFDELKADIETEVALILRVEEEDLQVKNNVDVAPKEGK